MPYRKVLSQSNDRAMLEIKAFQEVSARRLSFAKARVTSQKLLGPKSFLELVRNFFIESKQPVIILKSRGTLIWNARYCPTNNTIQANPYKIRGFG